VVALLAYVVHHPMTLAFLPGALSMALGVKDVVNVLLLTKVEEMQMLKTTTLMDPTILDCGKLTTLTGQIVPLEKPPATQVPILIVLSWFGNGEDTHGNFGLPVVLVDAAILHKKKKGLLYCYNDYNNLIKSFKWIE